MTQILLRGNRRIGMLAALVLVLALCGIVACMLAWPATLIMIGGGIAIAALLPAAFVIWQLCFVPRLAIDDDSLFVLVSNTAKPTAVPLDSVEVFFMGQGAVQGDEPGHPRDYQGAVAANVIVRLAESATEWQRATCCLARRVHHRTWTLVRRHQSGTAGQHESQFERGETSSS